MKAPKQADTEDRRAASLVEDVASCDATDGDASIQVASPSRLRIAHYLLFAAVCSVIFTIESFLKNGADTSDGQDWLGDLYTGITLLLIGVAFTALAVLLQRQWRLGEPILSCPGHWFLAVIAFAASIQCVTELFLQVNQPYRGDRYAAYYTWSLQKLLLCSSVGLACYLVAWRMTGNWWWRSILLVTGTVLFALAPQHVLVIYAVVRPWYGIAHDYAALGVSVAFFLLLALACWSDKRQAVQHDRFHWIGVIALGLAATVEGGYAVYWLYLA